MILKPESYDELYYVGEKNMEMYVYDRITGEIEVLEKNNLGENIVIIDNDKLKFENFNARADVNILKILKSDVSFKRNKIYSDKDSYRIKLRNEKKRSIKIPEEVVSQLIRRLGLIKVLRLKNPVYTVEEFLKELSTGTEKQIILKTKTDYRTITNSEMVIIGNIYDKPEMKLWEHQEENKLIFMQRP